MAPIPTTCTPLSGSASMFWSAATSRGAVQYLQQMVVGLGAALHFVDNSTAPMNGTRILDWARIGQGGLNITLNALLYGALTKMATLAPDLGIEQADAATWSSTAQKLKTSTQALLFDQSANLFRDNTTSSGSTIHPQDGNVLAITQNLTATSYQSHLISTTLAFRLTPFGAPAPELPSSISPFIGCQEIFSHFATAEGNASAALNLIKTQWRYMLRAFSNCSTIEGYDADGSLMYGCYPGAESFVSHAHAWSTGPVYSLLTEVVGLKASKIDVMAREGNLEF